MTCRYGTVSLGILNRRLFSSLGLKSSRSYRWHGGHDGSKNSNGLFWATSTVLTLSAACVGWRETHSRESPVEAHALQAFRKHQLLKRRKELALLQLEDPNASKPLAHRAWRLALRIQSSLLGVVRVCGRLLSLIVIFAPCLVSFPLWYMAFRPRVSISVDVTQHDVKLVEKEIPLNVWQLWWVYMLKWSLEVAGPTFIKLGQWMTSRTDIFPPYFCTICSQLQSGSKAHPMRKTLELLRQELGCEPAELFLNFNEKPLGVGAIAQVYRAQLKPHTVPAYFDRRLPLSEVCYDGDTIGEPIDVAVKVLHPHVHRLVELDLCILQAIALVCEHMPLVHWMSPYDELQTFGKMMRAQLDLRSEAHCLDVFNYHFQHRPSVSFPSPVYPYVTAQVLVETYHKGIPMTKFLTLGPTNDDSSVAAIGQRAFLQMLIVDNFVHADLHPGNLLVVYGEPVSLASRIKLRVRDFCRSFLVQDKLESNGGKSVDESEAFSLALGNQRRNLKPQKLKKLVSVDWIDSLNESESSVAFQEKLAAMHASYGNVQPHVVMIDAGLVSELSEKNLLNFLDLFGALANFDGERVAKLIIERSANPEAVVDPQIFMRNFQVIVDQLRSNKMVLSEIRMADLLLQAFDNVRKHHVKLEGEFVNVVISTLLVEGMARRLDPELDLLRSAIPLLAQRSNVRKYIVDTAFESTRNVLMDVYAPGEDGEASGQSAKKKQFGLMDPFYWNIITWVLFGRNWDSFVSNWFDESGLLQVEDLVFNFLD